MNDILTQFPIHLVAKGTILVTIFLHLGFAVIIYNHIRSLQKIVFINHATASPLIKTASLIYVFLVTSLFILALAIL